MQNNRSLEKELGARFSMICNAQKVNIKELADAIGLDVGTVLNFKTEGISNVEILMRVKQYLGVDLLKYRFELSITEMKALQMLVDWKGYIDLDTFDENKEKYDCEKTDMDSLLNMHLCVREQFKDRNSNMRDGFFLTEAGKNWTTLNCWSEFDNNDVSYCGVDRCVTYEEACDGYANYQEYVDNKGIEELKEFNEREWIDLIENNLDKAVSANEFKDKVYLLEETRKIADEKANEYGFAYPNVLMASVNSIITELDECKENEDAFVEELYRANDMISVYLMLYCEVKRNPIYSKYN